MRPLLPLLLATGLLLGGCSGPSETASEGPEALDGTECAVCGMTVSEQPSPRGQVAHRGGVHKHFCSIGDLVIYLETPGPLGEPEEVWVEMLPTELDPAALDTAPQPWVRAVDARFDIRQNRRVMGTPVLTSPAGTGSDSATCDWAELKRRLSKL